MSGGRWRTLAPHPFEEAPVEHNPFDDAIAENPYPTYRWLRDGAPVYRKEKISFYALSRFDDVLGAHRDTTTFISSRGATIERLDQGQDLLINKDDPQHTVHRKLVCRACSPRARVPASGQPDNPAGLTPVRGGEGEEEVARAGQVTPRRTR